VKIKTENSPPCQNLGYDWPRDLNILVWYLGATTWKEVGGFFGIDMRYEEGAPKWGEIVDEVEKLAKGRGYEHST
jgi:hypothetical protein